jgi:LCP family protein required for cell wall assembly
MRYIDLGLLPQSQIEQKRKTRKRIILFLASFLIVSIVGYVGYAFYWPISNILGQIFKNPGVVLSFFKEPSSALKSTDGKTNILLLGIDKRANVPYTFNGPNGKQEHNGFLSDTIIIISADLNTKQVSLISIPRDIWVSFPSWTGFHASEGKINSAYSLGDSYGYPGGGLALAERVVSEHLGIPIHYGARIDFEGFKQVINTLGGIDITVDKTFDDYNYPVEGKETAFCPDGTFNCRFLHLHFDAGPNHMDGDTALKYVRSRTGTNGEGSDFARARRQQKVIQAVFKEAISLNTLLNPAKLKSLLESLGQSVETNFDFATSTAAIKLAKQITVDNMKTFVLDPSTGLMYSPSPDAYGGAYVIIPKNSWQEVQLKIKEFLFQNQSVKR